MNRNKLEELREELYKLINEGICLYNENVVEVSEELDKLIIEEYARWVIEILVSKIAVEH